MRADAERSRSGSAGGGKGLRRLLVVLALALAVALPVPVAAFAQSSSGSLDRSVVQAMGADTSQRSLASAEKEGRTQVNVMREDGGWAFGSAVVEAPKEKGRYPEGWLFVAQEKDNGWNVALESDPNFAAMTREAPEKVVSDGEKSTFAAEQSADARTVSSAAPVKTGLRLPWRKGTSWKWTGGPHGWSTGYDRPYSSMDFAGPGADQAVRAAGSGTVYTMCSNRRGWIRIYHPNGYATNYYHLSRNIMPQQGSQITVGSFLGYTGTDTSCGGSATGPHVHFSLLQGDRFVSVDNKKIGGWVFQVGRRAYHGHARHRGGPEYRPGNLLYNFGP